MIRKFVEISTLFLILTLIFTCAFDTFAQGQVSRQPKKTVNHQKASVKIGKLYGYLRGNSNLGIIRRNYCFSFTLITSKTKNQLFKWRMNLMI